MPELHAADPLRPDMLPEGFDLDALLAPIPGELPQGPDLRRDRSGVSALVRLRDAVREARAAEREAESSDTAPVAPVPQWRGVARIATEGLAGHSKDLEIAAGLVEASVRLHGVRGLAAGAMLVRGLCEAFWDGLHPMPDDEGMSTRFAPVTGLSGADRDGTLLPALWRLAMFHRPDGVPFDWGQYERSRELAKITDEEQRERRIASGVLPYEDLVVLARTAASQINRLRADIAATQAAWAAMARSLADLARPEPGPSTGRVAALLEMMAAAAAQLGLAEEEVPAPMSVDVTPQPVAASATAATAPAATVLTPSAATADREAMLGQLSIIAEFFRRTEPGSPLSYTLEDAVRRARMTLPDLLAEVVTDERARGEILTALGIRPPQA